MQKTLLSTFFESNCINPIAVGELSNKATDLQHGDVKSMGFIGCEIDGTGTVAQWSSRIQPGSCAGSG